jgi:hypothetical protein
MIYEDGVILPDRQYRQIHLCEYEETEIHISFRAVTNGMIINTIAKDKPVFTTSVDIYDYTRKQSGTQ